MQVLRSPHAHARIRSIDTGPARAMPGVLAVLTGLDARAEGFADIPHDPLPKTRNDLALTGPGGSEVFIGAHPLLPHDTARHAGEAVAAVIAETPALAADAAERIAVDWEPLPAVADTREAAAPGAPLVWDGCADNVLVDCRFGDADGVAAAFTRAARIVELEAHLPRVAGAPLEPRAALGAFDAATGRYTLYAGRAARCGTRASSRRCSESTPTGCGSSAAMSAAISACATVFMSSSASCSGPPG